MTVRAGVVGLGFMGRRYVETLRQLEGVEVSAISDVRGELLRSIAAGTGAAAYESAQELVRSADVEAVFVCTPEDAHADVAVAAIEAGKHLLIEKPVTHDLASAARLRHAARASAAAGSGPSAAASGRQPTIMVGHLLRFEARWASAQRLIAEGRIGEVVSIATRRVGNVRDQDVLKGRTSIPLYYGVHDLDIVRWFAGSPAVSMQAARRSGVLRAAGFDIDDLYCAIVSFENGVLATAELGWHVPAVATGAPSSGITVVGTQGWLRVEQGQTGLEAWSSEGTGSPALAVDVSFWPDVHGRTRGALANELEHFVDCVRTGAAPVVSLDDGIEALRLSLAMEEAATTMSVVDLTTFGAADRE